MRKLLTSFFLHTIICSVTLAQAFEGILQIDYRSETGARNAIDVHVKGDKFYMQKVYGGCDRYNSYLYDTRNRLLYCFSPQNPQTALSIDVDKILDIYQEKQLKPGYHIHMCHLYISTGASKKISDIHTIQKKAADENGSYEIWVSDLQVNYTDLIPVLRILGYWGDAEDSNNVILESKTIYKKALKSSVINVTPVKVKVDARLIKMPEDYQVIDLDKFLVNEYKSPRFGDLVKAFTGF